MIERISVCLRIFIVMYDCFLIHANVSNYRANLEGPPKNFLRVVKRCDNTNALKIWFCISR